MSVYLTSPVYVHSIDDFERMDLHKRYTELLRSYEALVKARNDDKKAFEQQISAMRMIVGSEARRPRIGSSIADMETKLEQAQDKVHVLQQALECERKVNEELEEDLRTAVDQGIKYRDSLNILLNVRDKQRKGEEMRDRGRGDDVGSRKASLEEKERALELERRRVHELSNRCRALEDELLAAGLPVKTPRSTPRNRITTPRTSFSVRPFLHDGGSSLRGGGDETPRTPTSERMTDPEPITQVRRKPPPGVPPLPLGQGAGQGVRTGVEGVLGGMLMQARDDGKGVGGGQVGTDCGQRGEIGQEERRGEGKRDEQVEPESVFDLFGGVGAGDRKYSQKTEESNEQEENTRKHDDDKEEQSRDAALKPSGHERNNTTGGGVANGRSDQTDQAQNQVEQADRSGEGAFPGGGEAEGSLQPNGNLHKSTAIDDSLMQRKAEDDRTGQDARMEDERAPGEAPHARERATDVSAASPRERLFASPDATVELAERVDTPAVDEEALADAIRPMLQAAPNTLAEVAMVNAGLSSSSVALLAPVLQRHPRSVTKIDVSYNYLRDNGVTLLVRELPFARSLAHLDLGDNHIGDPGAAAVADVCSQLLHLRTLSLGGNAITAAGAQRLADALPPTLLALNLNFNAVGDAGARAVGEAVMSGALTLTNLHLNSNAIGKDGAQFLATAASFSRTLRQLYLRGNTDKGDAALLSADEIAAAEATRSGKLRIFV